MKKAPCNDCVYAQDPRPREIRWFLPHKIKEVLNQLEDAGNDLSLHIYCKKKRSIESLIAEQECEDQKAPRIEPAECWETTEIDRRIRLEREEA